MDKKTCEQVMERGREGSGRLVQGETTWILMTFLFVETARQKRLLFALSCTVALHYDIPSSV